MEHSAAGECPVAHGMGGNSLLSHEDGARADAPQCDNTYSWLRHAFLELASDPVCDRRRMYIWGCIQAATLAKVLDVDRISVIEFGVGGGAGLIALDRIAMQAERLTGVKCDVYGFDTGTGLPKPVDYRDAPNMWFEGQCPMNRKVLESQLQRASLRLGNVSETLPAFLTESIAPVGFVSFDLDLYSSTVDALRLFTAGDDMLLPRVMCYFDNILGHSYSDFTGERLAISEFNNHTTRKLSPVHGLKYFVPAPYRDDRYWECMYFAHLFHHRAYANIDAINKPVFVDANDEILRYPAQSDWRSRLNF